MTLKKINLMLYILIILTFTVSCDDNSTKPQENYMNITPAEAKNLIENNPDLLIIDVSDMWQNGHLPGALNFPLGDGSFENAVSTWDKNDKFLIYCHGDGPSKTAAQMLIDSGFSNVYRLEGNYGAWVDAGYDIEVEIYTDISASDLYQMMMDDPDLIVIDVSPLYDQGHIPGALNFPLGDGSFEAAIPSWNKNDKYVIYCHGDEPSQTSAQMLIDSGFSNVYRLEGNYGAWVDAGYDIEVEIYTDISASDLYQMMMDNPDLIVIDVSPLYDQGHIPGALNFPLGDGSFEAAIPSWNKNDKYVIYCHGDEPSQIAAQMLIDSGFSNVYRLEGNYGAWVDAGYPVETAQP